jgi:hypothetical protein
MFLREPEARTRFLTVKPTECVVSQLSWLKKKKEKKKGVPELSRWASTLFIYFSHICSTDQTSLRTSPALPYQFGFPTYRPFFSGGFFYFFVSC